MNDVVPLQKLGCMCSNTLLSCLSRELLTIGMREDSDVYKVASSRKDKG